MRTTEEVSQLINCLTNNEDTRQDLWVHYLSGSSEESLTAHLEQIKVEYSDDIELKKAVWNLIKNPISTDLSDFLIANFTDYERSVICFLTLGLDPSKISEIKGISQVRIRQTIAAIRYNKAWRDTDGLKETPIRSRKIRTNRRRN